MADILIPIADLQRLQADAAQAAAQIKAHEAEQAATTARTALAAGNVDAVVRSMRAEVDQANARADEAAATAALAKSLAGLPLNPGAADQLTTLWRSQLRVDNTPSGPAVRTQAFQPVNEFVSAQLSKPEFAHFLAANHAAPATPAPPAGTPPVTFPAPRTLGEAYIAAYQSSRPATFTDPRLNMNAAFGLKRQA